MTPARFDDIRLKVASGGTANEKRGAEASPKFLSAGTQIRLPRPDPFGASLTPYSKTLRSDSASAASKLRTVTHRPSDGQGVQPEKTLHVASFQKFGREKLRELLASLRSDWRDTVWCWDYRFSERRLFRQWHPYSHDTDYPCFAVGSLLISTALNSSKTSPQCC